jgi:predicted Fe-S protein YdhL (DUF1289 family)
MVTRSLYRRGTMAGISTPCTKVCSIDARTGLCIGCGRTCEEIAHWLSLNETERLRIMADLPARLRAASAAASAAKTA